MSMRNTNIEIFQEQTGLKPACGQQLDLLERMQQVAFDLIKALELEISGIRDGDGNWGGCYPVSELIFELGTLEHKCRESDNDMPV